MLIDQAKAVVDIEATYDWLLNQSILSIYVIDRTLVIDSHDVLLKVNDVYIHIFHDQRIYRTNNNDLADFAINNQAIKSAKHLVDRQLRCQQKLNKTKKNKSKHFFIGLSSIKVSYNGTEHPVDHQFGSKFLRQLNTICFNKDSININLFGIFGFVAALDKLVTPSNLLNFLNYYQKARKKVTVYDYESQLANKYITSPISYLPAVNIEKQLLENELIDGTDSTLYDFFRTDGYELKALHNMYAQSKPWTHLVIDCHRRLLQAKQAEYADFIMKSLLSECLYSRMKIMNTFNELVAGCLAGAAVSRSKGIFSYSNMGRYYLIVLYETDSQNSNSKAYLQEHYKRRIDTTLQLLNTQSLVEAFVTEVYILGVDVKIHPETAEMIIKMDVYG